MIAPYTKPNRPTLKGPANWIPIKEVFLDDNFLFATGFRLDGDKGNSSNISRSYKSSKTLPSYKFNVFFARTTKALHRKSWKGEIDMSKLSAILWKEYLRMGIEK